MKTCTQRPSLERTFVNELINNLDEGRCERILFDYLFTWYSTHSIKSKQQYHLLTVSAYIFLASVPIITIIKGVIFGTNPFEIIVAILTFMSGLCVFLLNTWKCQENWFRYRSCAESLKLELTRYVSKIEAYKDLNDEQKRTLFIERISIVAHSETAIWLEKSKIKS